MASAAIAAQAPLRAEDAAPQGFPAHVCDEECEHELQAPAGDEPVEDEAEASQ